MKITLGVFAHVDAGKTTFCECLLYQKHKTASPGRVDYGNTLMDHNDLEKRRGITIFSDMASFSHSGQGYYLIDTPGHIDFSGEMERVLIALDAAILLISAVDGVQSHTMTVYRLLKEKRIPFYIFINKMDQIGADISACIADIKTKLNVNICLLKSVDELESTEFTEWLCEYDDDLMYRYLEGELDTSFVLERIKYQIKIGNAVLGISGSALHQTGITEILDVIRETFSPNDITETNFAARVFKVIYDIKGTRITFFKCLGGTLKVRDEVVYADGFSEKINEIRDYQGKSYTSLNTVCPGDIVGVTGLTRTVPGMGLGIYSNIPIPTLRPTLKVTVLLQGNPYNVIMNCLRKLEAQDPLLEVGYEPELKEISVCIMGKIHLEVLKELIFTRFDLNIDFSECRVVYHETIVSPVMGYGHFEPLRHYAEVHLRLEPNPHGGVAFRSELHTDRLAKQYQNLIRHYLLERKHRGILTGSLLSDICFVLTNGAIHLKHTDGGDLREASYRAVRQGLEKAKSILLEPYYEFFIDVDAALVGRVLSDITKMHGTFEPPEIIDGRACIRGNGPAATFIDYQTVLLSFTKGMGAISLCFLDYFPCHNPEQVISKIDYQKERDLENVSNSIFCAKGAGFEVKWYEAESYMHLL